MAMASLLDRTATGRSAGLWLVLLPLLGVLGPTACVLWFMAAAMRNERLAVRQKLTDVYAAPAARARSRLEQQWAGRLRALDGAAGAESAQVFAALVTGGVAEAAVVCDASGRAAYPDITHAPPAEPNAEALPWLPASKLEHELARFDEAAEAYAQIAEAALSTDHRALALRAQARCLIKAGRKPEAVKILSGPLAAPEMRAAADAAGRRIAPSSLLLALQLMEDRGGADFSSLAGELAGRLNDYGPPVMPAGQRRFLMRSLRRIAPDVALPTLPAEMLAAEYLQTTRASAQPGRLSPAGAGQTWHVASADGKVIAIFRTETLLAAMKSAIEPEAELAGAKLSPAPPRAPVRPEPFLSVPAGRQMPGWQLHVQLLGENPFAEAARRHNLTHLWTGMLGIGAVAVLAAVAAGYLRRQMRLARLRNDLIATVSHELKTPLASMRVLLDTLREGRWRDPAQPGEYLELIARENERLSRLIDNFLAFSRMERNKRAFEFAPVRVEEIVSSAVESARAKFDCPGCRLEVEVAPGLPAVSGDRDALITVLLNLLDNAHKYSGEDKHVVVRAYASAGSVCLQVADNGIGLSRRAARKAFDRFYQVDRALSRRAGGCGLGLSIVKFIVDAHGGAVDVFSRPGKGSTFTVSLSPTGAADADGKIPNDGG